MQNATAMRFDDAKQLDELALLLVASDGIRCREHVLQPLDADGTLVDYPLCVGLTA